MSQGYAVGFVAVLAIAMEGSCSYGPCRSLEVPVGRYEIISSSYQDPTSNALFPPDVAGQAIGGSLQVTETELTISYTGASGTLYRVRYELVDP